MALIKCPSCGKEISDKAKKCIHCGYSLKKKRRTALVSVLLVLMLLITIIGSSCYVLYKNKWDYSEVINTISAGNFSCILGHDWKKATCTEPKKCLICGTTRGEALGHTWREASCVEPKTCTVCLITEGEALGHFTRMGTCSKCGDYITDLEDEFMDIVDALGGDILNYMMGISLNIQQYSYSYSDSDCIEYTINAIENSRDASECLEKVINKAEKYDEFTRVVSYLNMAKSSLKTYPEGATVNAYNSDKYMQEIQKGTVTSMEYISKVLEYKFN